jgi:hypothetical protein
MQPARFKLHAEERTSAAPSGDLAFGVMHLPWPKRMSSHEF